MCMIWIINQIIPMFLKKYQIYKCHFIDYSLELVKFIKKHVCLASISEVRLEPSTIGLEDLPPHLDILYNALLVLSVR